jgi:NitT/TauT family transport system substrate-binding protein
MSKPKKAQVWTRRQALWLMTGFTGSIALHACGQQSSTSSESTKAETGSNELTSAATGSTLWIGYTPLYIALEKGFFKEEGLNLDYKVFSGTGEADAAFAAGRLQGENVVTSEAVALASRGLDYRIIMVADTSFGGDGILASNSIGSIADFKGERIAVEEGGVSHFFLLQVLNKEAGLSGDDISIVNVTPDAAAAAYQTGKVDIAVTYSPFLQKANQARQDGRIIYDTSKMPTAIVDVYIFSPQFIEENPGTAKAFVRGILRGKEFLNTNREEALAIAGERLELAPEQVAEQLKGVNLTSLKKNIEMLGNPQSDIYLAKHMNSLGQFLENQKQIQKVPGEMPKLLDPQFVEAVGKNA